MKTKPLVQPSKLCLFLGLLCFIAFHVLPLSPPFPRNGAVHVLETWAMLRHYPRFLMEPEDAIPISLFLVLALLVLATPFIGSQWARSKIAWGLVFSVSGIVMIALSILVVRYDLQSSAGFLCLPFASVFNFTGLLLLRREVVREPQPT